MGVMVVPFATDDPIWTMLEAASLTLVPGRKDPCVAVPATNLTCHARVASSWEHTQHSDRTGLAVLAINFSCGSGRTFETIAPDGLRAARLPPRPSFKLLAEPHGRKRPTQHRLGDGHAPCRPRRTAVVRIRRGGSAFTFEFRSAHGAIEFSFWIKTIKE